MCCWKPWHEYSYKENKNKDPITHSAFGILSQQYDLYCKWMISG